MTTELVRESKTKRWCAGAFSVVRKSPATVFLMLVVLIATAAIGGLANGVSDDVLAVVGIDLGDVSAAWWTVLVSAFFATSWLDALLALVVIAVGVGIAERIVGSTRAVTMFLVGQIVSSLALVALTAAGTAGNDSWLSYLGGEYVVGAYGGAAAALGAATASLESLWRHRLRTWLLAFSLMFVFYVGVAQTLQLLLGGVFGLLVGRLVGTGRRHATGKLFARPSLREARFLLATVVGVFAVGPLIAQFTDAFAVGPLSTVSSLMLAGRPDADELHEMCDADAACINLQSVVGVSSVGAVLLSLVPVILLLVCSEGLRRGRRLALGTALVINALIAIVVLGAVVVFLASPDLVGGNLELGFLAVYILPSVLVPAAIALLLFMHRGKFPVISRARAAKKLFRRTAMVGATLIFIYTLMWFVEGNLGRSNLGNLLAQLTHVLIPFPMPFVVVLPQGLVTTIIYGFGGAVLWLAFAVLAYKDLRLYTADSANAKEARTKVRELLKDGGGSLSWMSLWANNVYWFSEDGRNAIGYQVHNGVAVTIAGPFGAVDSQAQATRNFVSHCVEQGLIPCFYSVRSEVGEALDGLHFRALEVAEETLLNIEAMTFKGKEWQNVRTALNRAGKLGIQDHWYSYSAMPPGIRAQLAEISEEWVSEKSLPEMGFTLGGLDELKDAQVLCCVAVDGDGLVHGVTSWLPVYAERDISGWTLDFMRRRQEGFKGVMEFLIASAVTHFKEEVRTISLSGSPLANSGSSETDESGSVIEKVLTMLGNALEPMYGFKSLAAFKSRFQPEHQTLYLLYNDSLALPAIGLAITAAYLPALSARDSAGFLRQITAKGENKPAHD
ncbi:bifunctional lysylphosphatidylglycerol flippase/synthetase MprF [Arthrobacter alpinus]|uniref:bifunctional lysylphosphatidylglycerol flippase/synthetase MprF n=1 Tax=Arthrobacter alpinus TaxID=656366 RepID=UPI0016449909|nr:phosphatidylglycerol lysyltransferase domain-containing protein [Arthrobacter alpinus]